VAQQYSGAGITGGGGPPGATLALDFMSSGNMPPGVTFTRASTATYTDASGVIQTAAVNQPRWEARGLLIEEARTNVILNSGNIALWGLFGSVQPVVTANQVTAPDGTLTAARVVYPAVSGAGTFSVFSQSATLSAAAYSFSLWLRGNAGGERVYICATPDGATYYKAAAILTTAWQRFSFVTPNLTAAPWFFETGTDLRDATQASTPAQTIYAWGGQVEPGTFPTSVIYTVSSPVTRAFDNCFIAPANMAPWFASPGGTWFAEFIDNTAFGLTSPRVIGNHGGTGEDPLWVNSSGFFISSGGGQINTINTVVLGAVSKGVSVQGGGTGKICLNGGGIGTGAQTGFATLATAGVGIGGANPGVAIESMSGIIRRVQYWPRVLSDAEMQQVTT
jgi:hypothetical protein